MARLGLFDDLVPRADSGGTAARGRLGLFDDLVPSDYEGLGGLSPEASPVQYAAQSMSAAKARLPAPASPEQEFADVRAFANEQMQQPGTEPESRWGDVLKPAFGGHNPIAETFDRVIQPFLPEELGGAPDTASPEQKQWLGARSGGERAADTAAFAASMPVRMATRGQYGAGDVLSGLGFEEAGQSVGAAEQDFARANRRQLEAAQLVGEGILGATGASMAPLMARNPPRPGGPAPRTVQSSTPPGLVEQIRRATDDLVPVQPAPVPTYQTPPSPQMASGPWSGVARARNYVRDTVEQELPIFGPAVAQAARGGEGVGAMTRMVQSMPGVGRHMERKNQEFLDAAGARYDQYAGGYARVGDPEQAGAVARRYYDRFVNERTIDRDDIRTMPDDELARLASQPARDVRSVATAKDVRYERAWRNIPEEYRNGASFKDEARLMGQMPATREFLRSIYDSNVRKVNEQSEAARVAGQRRRSESEQGVHPTRQGGMIDSLIPFRDGILGRSIRAILDGNWSGTLQTMRDIRSDIRRANSRVADTEGNVLNKTQLEVLHNAVSRDMDTLMQRMANEFETGIREGSRGRRERFADPNPQMAARIRAAAREMKVADNMTRRYARVMEDLEKITGAQSDIGIIQRVLADASEKTPNTHRLLRIRQTAPHDILDAIASGVLNHMANPTGSARGATQEAGFSIGRAVTAWNNMGSRQRQLIFGHRPELYRQLNQFFRVAQGMKDFEALANTSRSGTHMIASSMILAGPAAMLSSLPALLWTAAAATGVSYFLTSPTYVQWLTRGMKIQDAINKGDMTATAARAAVERQSKALAKIVSRDKKLDPRVAEQILRGLAASTAQPAQQPLPGPVQ